MNKVVFCPRCGAGQITRAKRLRCMRCGYSTNHYRVWFESPYPSIAREKLRELLEGKVKRV